MDRLRLCLGTTEQAQGRHSLEHVQEVAAETLQDGPLAFRAALGHPADQHHEHRDQGHGQRDQHRRQHVGEQDPDAGDQRDRGRERQRGKELADVRLQLVDTGGDDRRLATREPSGRSVTIERGMVENGTPDVVAHRPHRPGRRPLGDGGAEPSHDRDRDEHQRERSDAGGDLTIGDQFREPVRQYVGLNDHEYRRHHRDAGDDGHVGA